jgi:cyclic 2,3-diphosphoglycerate synthase
VERSRAIALVDGEHYPPVTRWALEVASVRGYDVVAALLVGGTEKIDPAAMPELGVLLRSGLPSAPEALKAALDEFRPAAVLDLSDEPVLGYRERMHLAAVALARGVRYIGADFRFDPPVVGPPLPAPTVAVIGTGKRTGKTSVAGELARLADARGLEPAVVAMGRGGPPEPEVAERGSVTMDRLLELVRDGRHAASDYLEDALTTGVLTVGARRAGGGLAGAPFASNVREAAALALARGPGLVILEGSGAAVPPIPWDAGILVVPATAPEEYLAGYLGPFRLLLSDLVVVTMSGSPESGLANLSATTSLVHRFRADVRTIVTDLRPHPLGEVRGRSVFFTTTATEHAAARQVARLEATHQCRVVGWSARLADRTGLARDLEAAKDYEVLLTELKAAAVDIACRRAIDTGAHVIFVDNRPELVRGEVDLRTAFSEVIERARTRFAERSGGR